MSLKYVLAERPARAQITAPKWLEKHASLASLLITSFFFPSKQSGRTSAHSFKSVKYLRSGNVKTSLVGKSIKAWFPCEFIKARARRSGGEKYRGRDGGWKWSGASALCECLCAARAKKNKAWATLGSDFSAEAWQETGSSWGVGGGFTLHVLAEKRERQRDLETEQSSSSLSARPAMMADVQSESEQAAVGL